MTPTNLRIYTKRWCSYCWAARRLFSKLGLEYEEIRIDGDPELRHKVATSAGGWPTVPMIFCGTQFIGGYREVSALHRQGDLLQMCHRQTD